MSVIYVTVSDLSLFYTYLFRFVCYVYVNKRRCKFVFMLVFDSICMVNKDEYNDCRNVPLPVSKVSCHIVTMTPVYGHGTRSSSRL